MSEFEHSEDQIANAISQVEFLIERERFDQAKHEIQNVLAISPNNIDALYYAGWLDWREDKLDDGLKVISNLLSINPNHYGARRLLSDLYHELDRNNEAEQTLLQLLKDYPDDPDTYADYAYLMLHTLHVEKAQLLAQEALKREPEHLEAMRVNIFCKLIIEGPSDDTYNELQNLAERFPDIEGTAYTIISVLTDSNRDKEALVIAQNLLRVYPTSPGALEIVKELRYINHWSMTPLRLLKRYGWAGSVAVWLVFLIAVKLIDSSPYEDYLGAVVMTFFAYVVYSWAYPPILKSLMDT